MAIILEILWKKIGWFSGCACEKYFWLFLMWFFWLKKYEYLRSDDKMKINFQSCLNRNIKSISLRHGEQESNCLNYCEIKLSRSFMWESFRVLTDPSWHVLTTFTKPLKVKTLFTRPSFCNFSHLVRIAWLASQRSSRKDNTQFVLRCLSLPWFFKQNSVISAMVKQWCEKLLL